MFAGAQPRFISVGNVSFHRPVEIGNLLRFDSVVAFAETPEQAADRGGSRVDVGDWGHGRGGAWSLPPSSSFDCIRLTVFCLNSLGFTSKLWPA
jgi:hypothetical protein